MTGTAAGAALRDLADQGRLLAQVERDGRSFARGVVPVLDATGARVGGLFVQHDVTALRDRARGEALRGALLVLVMALAVLALLVVLFDRLVFRRLERMTREIEGASVRLAGGDYEVGDAVKPGGADEIGRFEEFLARFLRTIGSTLREFEKRQRKTG